MGRDIPSGPPVEAETPNGGDPFEGLSPESRAIVERQARELEREGRAQREANAEVLPGPLLEAYAGLPGSVAGLQVRALVHWDFVVLRRLDSPLLKQLSKKRKRRREEKKTTPFSDGQASEMVYQFTRPCDEVERIFQKTGAAGFQKEAREQIGMRLGPVEVGLLVQLVEREFVRYFSTFIKYAPKERPKGGGDTIFTGPATEPAPKTGLVGGSTITAG